MAACTIMFKTDIQCATYKPFFEGTTLHVYRSSPRIDTWMNVERGHFSILFILFGRFADMVRQTLAAALFASFAIRCYAHDDVFQETVSP